MLLYCNKVFTIKHLSQMILLLLGIIALSCSKENDEDVQVTIEVTQEGEVVPKISISGMSVEEDLDVKVLGADWEVEEEIAWLEATKLSAEKLRLKISENTSSDSRSGEVVVIAQSVSLGIVVEQRASPTLTLSKAQVELPFTAGSTTLEITSSEGNWTARKQDANLSWITALDISGQRTLSVSYDAPTDNNSREAVVVIQIDGFSVSEEITFTQKGLPNLTVSKTDHSVTKSSGSITVDVSTSDNDPWTAVRKNVADTWITNLENLNTSHSMLKVSYDANTGAERSAVIVVTVDGTSVSEEITLTQAEFSILTIDDTSPNVNALSGSVTLNVSTDATDPWTAARKDAADTWITSLENLNTAHTMLKISYDANTGAERSAVIVVEVDGFSVSQEITLTQAALPVLSIDNTTPSINAIPGNLTLNVSTSDNDPWTAVKKNAADTWITNLENLNTSHSMLKVSYAANAGAERSAVIVVTVDGFSVSQEITITQAAAMISITPVTLEVSSGAGSRELPVNYAGPLWQVSDTPEWLTATRNNKNTLSITYEENTGSQRQVIITLSAGNASTTLTFRQLAPPISVSRKFISASAESGTIEVTVNATEPWSLEEDVDWISVTPTSGGIGSTTLSITYKGNAGATRFNHIYVAPDSGDQSSRVVVTVSQTFPKAFITKSDIMIPSRAGEHTVDLADMHGLVFQNSHKWYAQPYRHKFNGKYTDQPHSWVTSITPRHLKKSTIQETMLRVTVSENTSAKNRVAKIRIVQSAGGGAWPVIFLKQEKTPILCDRFVKVGPGSGTAELAVETTNGMNWTIDTNAGSIAWINAISKTSDTPPKLEIQYQMYTDLTRREELIQLSAGTGNTISIRLLQEATPTSITLQKKEGVNVTNLTSQQMTLPAKASNTTLVINTNPSRAWQVTFTSTTSIAPNWLTLDKSSGNSTDELVLTTKHNFTTRVPALKGYLTITSGPSKKRLNLVQVMPSVSLVDPTDRRITALGNAGMKVFMHDSDLIKDGAPNARWYAKSSDKSWLGAGPSFWPIHRMSGTDPVMITWKENPTNVTRRGSVKLCGLSLCLSPNFIYITQKGYIDITPTDMVQLDNMGNAIVDVPESTGNLSVEIQSANHSSGSRWTPTENSNWISTVKSAPNLAIAYTANTGSGREADITITAGSRTAKITIRQKSSIIVSPSSIVQVGPKAGTATFTVREANDQAVSPTHSSAWITSATINSNTLEVSYQGNTGKQREAQVTLTAGASTTTITLRQRQPVINYTVDVLHSNIYYYGEPRPDIGEDFHPYGSYSPLTIDGPPETLWRVRAESISDQPTDWITVTPSEPTAWGTRNYFSTRHNVNQGLQRRVKLYVEIVSNGEVISSDSFTYAN